MALISFIGGLTKRGRRYKDAAYKLEKARAGAALEDLRGQIAFRETEDPREQAMLKQSAFARGLGKSTIEQQDRTRLTDIQARRMAAMRRQEDLGVRGLALIRQRRKFQRRQAVWDMADQVVAAMITMGMQAGKPQTAAQEQAGGGMAWQGAAGGMAGGGMAGGAGG